MPALDETLIFRPLSFGLLTISDTRTSAEDRSGGILAEGIATAGHRLKARLLVKDDATDIFQQVKAWSADPAIDVVITTGGTGLTGRDVTIEAIAPLFDKTLDGFSVLFHRLSFETVGLATLLSRACAGLINGTIVFCLPGSTGAVRQAWEEIIRNALDSRYRPCSLVDLIPRFME